jgi:LPS export ABC transporter permease LptF/LPS export ABC transporter permease LptG
VLKRLDRYLLAQFLGPIAVGFLLYTSLLLVRFLFISAEMIIKRDVPASTVLQLIGLSLPNMVVLSLPMSFLFGLLLALGRLSADSEIVALRACGVSSRRLYLPMLLLAIGATGLNLALMVHYLPRANRTLVEVQTRTLLETAGAQIEPRIFYDELVDKTLYVFETSGPHRPWKGVFLADSILAGRANEVTVAEGGQLYSARQGGRITMRLYDATRQKVDPRRADRFEISRQRSLDLLVQDTTFANREPSRSSISRGVREMSLDELRTVRRDPSQPAEVRNLALVEIHKKFSIPFANLAFALLALPLGVGYQRGGKASGFTLSLLVIALYYVMISNGEEAARFGRLPAWLAMWAPNLMLAVLAALLLWYREALRALPNSVRMLPGRLLLPLLVRMPRLGRFTARQTAAVPIAGAQGAARTLPRRARLRFRVRFQLPRLSFDFPTLIDRLVLRTFLFVFLLSLLSGIIIFVLFDLGEIFDEILKNHVPLSVLLEYYADFSLRMVVLIAPLVFLVATLLTVGLFVRTSEVTACKALGISIFRFSFSIILTSLVIGSLLALAQSFLFPATELRLEQLQARIHGQKARERSQLPDRRWFADENRYIFNFSDLGVNEGRFFLRDLQVFDFDQRHRLVRRMAAELATFQDGRWSLANGWARSFDRGDIVSYRPFTEPVRVNFPESPDYFRRDDRTARAMDFQELRTHIARLAKQGLPVSDLEVELHRRVAFPLLSLVMSVIALPFALRLGRQGALYGTGVALLLGILLLGCYAFFEKLGDVGWITPVVAVWSPAALYSLLAGYLLLRVRS